MSGGSLPVIETLQKRKNGEAKPLQILVQVFEIFIKKNADSIISTLYIYLDEEKMLASFFCVKLLRGNADSIISMFYIYLDEEKTSSIIFLCELVKRKCWLLYINILDLFRKREKIVEYFSFSTC